MTEEERRRINTEARATLERLRRFKPSAAAELPPVDPVEKWRRDMDALTADRERAEEELKSSPRPVPVDWAMIDALADGLGQGVAQLLDEERDAIRKACRAAVDDVIDHVRDRADQASDAMASVRAELRELRAEYVRLGSEVTELRTQLALDRGKVVDMSSPSASRRDVN
jgi:hypothetical protein